MEYRLLHAKEAPALVELVQACYGDSYPSDMFYDVAMLEQAIEQGLLVSAGAVGSDGRLVGHLGTLFEAPGARTADGITGIVLPEMRKQGVLDKLSGVMVPAYQQHALLGLQLYAVTTHVISQRMSLDNGALPTGVLLSDYPARMDARGIDSEDMGQSRPALVMFFPFQALPARTLAVPACYADVIASIYTFGALARQIQVDDMPLPAHGSCQGTMLCDRRKSLQRLYLYKLGSDWRHYCEQQLVQARAGEVGAWYIDVPLVPGCGAVVDGLRGEGWFFGGLVLERRETDYLRMQFTSAAIHPERVQTATAESRQLLEFVLADRAAVAGPSLEAHVTQ